MSWGNCIQSTANYSSRNRGPVQGLTSTEWSGEGKTQCVVEIGGDLHWWQLLQLVMRQIVCYPSKPRRTSWLPEGLERSAYACRNNSRCSDDSGGPGMWSWVASKETRNCGSVVNVEDYKFHCRTNWVNTKGNQDPQTLQSCLAGESHGANLSLTCPSGGRINSNWWVR